MHIVSKSISLRAVILVLMLAFVSSCFQQAPKYRRGRTSDSALETGGTNNNNAPANNGNFNSGTGDNNNNNNPPPSEGGGEQPSVVPGFENCNMQAAATYFHPSIGNVAICQNTQDDRFFQFMFLTTNTQTRTCFIPTTRDGQGNSTYVGYSLCTGHEANKVYTNHPNLPFEKNRSPGNYSQFPINGLMIMKEPIIYNYFDCMNAQDPYVFMQLCNAFKSAGQYIDISL